MSIYEGYFIRFTHMDKLCYLSHNRENLLTVRAYGCDYAVVYGYAVHDPEGNFTFFTDRSQIPAAADKQESVKLHEDWNKQSEEKKDSTDDQDEDSAPDVHAATDPEGSNEQENTETVLRPDQQGGGGNRVGTDKSGRRSSIRSR